MSWTYDPSLLSTSPLYQLRWLVGDTIATDPQMQDQELAFALTQRSSVYGAASDVCRSLASQLARQADSVQGNLRNSYSSRSRAYAASAQRYELMAIVRSAGVPYSGMTSKTDYNSVASDTDRLAPQFSIGMDENLLPVGPVNTERNDIGST